MIDEFVEDNAKEDIEIIRAKLVKETLQVCE